MEKTIWLFTNKSIFNKWLCDYTYTSVEVEPYDNCHPDEVFIKVTGKEKDMRKLAKDYASNTGNNSELLFTKIWAGEKIVDL